MREKVPREVVGPSLPDMRESEVGKVDRYWVDMRD